MTCKGSANDVYVRVSQSDLVAGPNIAQQTSRPTRHQRPGSRRHGKAKGSHRLGPVRSTSRQSLAPSTTWPSLLVKDTSQTGPRTRLLMASVTKTDRPSRKRLSLTDPTKTDTQTRLSDAVTTNVTREALSVISTRTGRRHHDVSKVHTSLILRGSTTAGFSQGLRGEDTERNVTKAITPTTRSGSKQSKCER